jgi:hypothetical protein
MHGNLTLKKATAVVALTGMIVGCANVGPPEFASCLQDDATMSAFSARTGMKQLVGAVGKDGDIYCIQGQQSLIFGETGNPINLCMRSQSAGGMRHCAVLATHTMTIFESDASKARPKPGYQVRRINADTIKNKLAPYDMENAAELAAGVALIIGVGALAVMGAKAEAREERDAADPGPWVPGPSARTAASTRPLTIRPSMLGGYEAVGGDGGMHQLQRTASGGYAGRVDGGNVAITPKLSGPGYDVSLNGHRLTCTPAGQHANCR